MTANGHEVDLIVPNNPEPESAQDPYKFYGVEKNFPIHRLPWLRLPGKRLVCGALAARNARRWKIDLVYARSLYAAYFSSWLGLPYVIELHTPIVDAGKFPEWVFSRIIRSPALRRLVVISKSLKTYYLDRYEVREEMIKVVPDAAEDMADSRQVELKGSRFKVGYVGHLYSGRGIETIGKLSESCSWAEFHCVGGTDKDIRKWRKDLNGQSNVTFHGFVQPSEVGRYLQAFDVLIAPYRRNVSIYGGGSDTAEWMSPLKLFEYMSAGKPILCSDLPVLREVLTDGHNALLRDPDDIDAWRRALEQLRDDDNIREQLGATARREYEAKYTWEARAEKVLEGLDCK